MRERPILFSAPMVRALLAGTKTQTRRALRVQPPARTGQVSTWHHPDPRPHFFAWVGLDDGGAEIAEGWCHPCPHGQPGDRLWVREAWRITGDSPTDTLDMFDRDDVQYRADCDQSYIDKYRPSIHMPRRFSRIDLEVTGVRVERLQDISEPDALAEGIVATYGGYGLPEGEHFHAVDPRQSYWSLWEAINGPGSVEANPWVGAVAFRRVSGPPNEKGNRPA